MIVSKTKIADMISDHADKASFWAWEKLQGYGDKRDLYRQDIPFVAIPLAVLLGDTLIRVGWAVSQIGAYYQHLLLERENNKAQ